MVAADEFIEYKVVHNNMYGTTKSQLRSIQEAEKIPLLDIDVQGALTFQQVFPDSNFVAVLPTGVKMLRSRLEGRGTETKEKIDTRVGNAVDELRILTQEKKDIIEYRVVNDDLEVAKRTVELLFSGLYPEELFGENTQDLIDDSPVLNEVRQGSVMKKVAMVAIVGAAIAAGAFIYMRNQKTQK